MQEGNEDDLALMDEKERKKEIVRHEREAEETKKKKEREDEWTMEKVQKIVEKKKLGTFVKDAQARDICLLQWRAWDPSHIIRLTFKFFLEA